MSRPAREVFESVSRCRNVRICLDTAQPHPCRAIVEYQVKNRGVTSYNDFQVPEPWVGQIDIAPILFVASNPSIGDDDHASGTTPDDVIWESHHLAHGGGRRQYILDGIRTMTPDGTPIKAVRYWSGALARARELIPDRPVMPGRDYALTEIVHCKSPHEIGIGEAAQTCADMHMENVMSVAAARVVIAVGAFAHRWFLGTGTPIPEAPIQWTRGGQTRLVAFTAHFSPSRGGPQMLSKRYPASVLDDLRRACRTS